MMRGYWNDPERTAEALQDGWLVSGDLGRLDERGDLHLVGRRTEMYIRGGYNVYPGEVENALVLHPAVDKAAVLGCAAPLLGEIGVAFVVLAAVTGVPGNAPSLEELRLHCRTLMADYKAPDVVVAVDELPLTAMSKVDKRALRPRAEQEALTWRR
jgi:acyl-CoA synthetase (AMP-forming)/AMP-acid ligase II